MTAKVETHPDNDAITNVGSNYRIEPGPPRITSVATDELLHNDNTAAHYHAPIVEGDNVTFAKDADGKPIKLNEEFTYLDWGGDKYEGKRTFYIYEKTPVDSENEFTKDGGPNPHFVPAAVREAAEKGEHGDNRVFYDYIWAEVATRSSLEAAIEFAQKKAVD